MALPQDFERVARIPGQGVSPRDRRMFECVRWSGATPVRWSRESCPKSEPLESHLGIIVHQNSRNWWVVSSWPGSIITLAFRQD